MKLERVTISGADCSLGQLAAVTTEFPFVEWGILAGEGHDGTARYPAYEWIHALKETEGIHRGNLSVHIQGKWLRALMNGINIIPSVLCSGFGRMQLNFHSQHLIVHDPLKVEKLLSEMSYRAGPSQFIFQIDGKSGMDYLQSIKSVDRTDRTLMTPLFGKSGGAGVTPSSWPKPEVRERSRCECRFVPHGYAGGIGPQNIRDEIIRIRGLVDSVDPETRVWIDMETHVRTGEAFDISKVLECLEIARPFVILPTSS